MAYQAARVPGPDRIYFDLYGARLDPTQGGTPAPGNVYYDNGVANVPEPVTGLSGNADNLANAIRADVLAGLSQRQKTLPSRWLYDQRGSELFEEITRLDEYYLTRTETAILRSHADEMAALCGEGVVLLEYGAGAAIKSEILINALQAPRLYAPIDIAADFLAETIERFGVRFPELPVRPIITDFTVDFDIPADIPARPRAAFFPGSTLGNLGPSDAAALFRRMRKHVGRGGKAIIGVDLRKDVETLIAAYDDKRGVTADFNLNLLRRINRELKGDFALQSFAHEARWNESESAIEMHLVSLKPQTVSVDGSSFAFVEGETIHTETCRKFDVAGFAHAAQQCGWRGHSPLNIPARRHAWDISQLGPGGEHSRSARGRFWHSRQDAPSCR